VKPRAMQDRGAVDPFLSIGLFSRSSLVSVKAQRSNHEQGLLATRPVGIGLRVSTASPARIHRRTDSCQMISCVPKL
jgi:hypothetical protein